MPKLTLQSTISAAKEQVSCELDGEMVILNLEDGVYYGLNRIGSRVWNLIQEPRMIATIRDLLLAEYEVDAARCEHDLFVLLENLAGAQLVEITDEAD